MLKPGVGDPSVHEVKPLQSRQALQVLKPGVGDPSEPEVELPQSRQAFQMR